MKLFLSSVLAAGVLLAASGCDLKRAAIPGADIPFAKADFTVLGNTNAEACGTYIFGINWAELLQNDRASISAGSGGLLALLFGGVGSPEAAGALYMALEKIPEATHLLSPRVHTVTTGFAPFGLPFFASRCAVVDARGVVIGKKPIPAAQLQ